MFPPNPGAFGGPPPGGGVARLSQMPLGGQAPGQAPNSAGPAGAPSPPTGGGLPRLFFGVEQALNTIASAVPGESEQIDSIKAQLREVLSKTLQSTRSSGSGTAGLKGGPGSPDGTPTPTGTTSGMRLSSGGSDSL